MDQNIILGIGLLIIILFFININNLTHFENFQPNTNKDINKTYLESYIDINKTIFEYITKKKIPTRFKSNSGEIGTLTITDYYNKINKRVKELYVSNNCGFIYKYYENEELKPGSMYLTESGIAFTILDLNNSNGLISIIDENNTLVLSDNIITHQIKKKEYNVDPIKGIITVFINPNSFGDTFFSLGKEYILYPCMIKEHASNVSTPSSLPKTIDEFIDYNNIGRTIGIFIFVFIMLLLIYNWKYIYAKVSGYFNKNKIKIEPNTLEDIYSEPKKIYIGGYDYKDYSE